MDVWLGCYGCRKVPPLVLSKRPGALGRPVLRLITGGVPLLLEEEAAMSVDYSLARRWRVLRKRRHHTQLRRLNGDLKRAKQMRDHQRMQPDLSEESVEFDKLIECERRIQMLSRERWVVLALLGYALVQVEARLG